MRIPSLSLDERQAADWMEALLRAEGLAPIRVGNNVVCRVCEGPGPSILLNSHLDTVPAAHGWTAQPWAGRWEAGRLVGLGANDAKGCVVAMLESALQLRASSRPGSLWVVFSACEETGGEGLDHALPHLPAPDLAVIGEPTGLIPVRAQKGLLVLRGEAAGVAAHAAHGEAAGVRNAVHGAARDIAKLACVVLPGEHPLLGPASVQVTGVQGGTARNAIPDRCEYWVDVRLNPGMDPGECTRLLASGLEGRLEVHSDRMRAVETPAGHPLIRAAEQVTGNSAIGSRTVSDWVHLGGIPAVKLGPGETERSHRSDEFLMASELEDGIRVYTALVTVLWKGNPHA